jgi:succinoglycan biosynthesis protein ExoU
MTDQVGVGVIIAAFNACDTIGRAVRSALAEDLVQEVIVVDDGSRDETPARARQADDGTGRLSVIVLGKNAGPAAARNIALQRLRSPYFCVLDADDYFLPGRITRLLASTDCSWDMLADDLILVYGEMSDRDLASWCQAKPGDGGLLDLRTFVAANISRPGKPRGELGFLKPIVRRAFVQTHGLRYDETLRLGEDYAFYVEALIAGAKFRLVGACGYVAVERASSLSARHTGADLQSQVDFDDRVLARGSGLTEEERKLVAAHRHATARKVDHMAVLDRKRNSGRLAALAMLLQMPSSAAYILSETARAKVAALLERISLRGARDGRGKVRLLVGLPRGEPQHARPTGAGGDQAGPSWPPTGDPG